MPCDRRSLRPKAFSALPSSFTPLHFASLRPAFLLDQTPPRLRHPVTCSTSTQHQLLPSKYDRPVWQVVIQSSGHPLCWCNRDLNVLCPHRFPVRRTLCTCISCLRWKIPVWERWSPTLLLRFSMLSLPYRYMFARHEKHSLSHFIVFFFEQRHKMRDTFGKFLTLSHRCDICYRSLYDMLSKTLVFVYSEIHIFDYATLRLIATLYLAALLWIWCFNAASYMQSFFVFSLGLKLSFPNLD